MGNCCSTSNNKNATSREDDNAPMTSTSNNFHVKNSTSNYNNATSREENKISMAPTSNNFNAAENSSTSNHRPSKAPENLKQVLKCPMHLFCNGFKLQLNDENVDAYSKYNNALEALAGDSIASDNNSTVSPIHSKPSTSQVELVVFKLQCALTSDTLFTDFIETTEVLAKSSPDNTELCLSFAAIGALYHSLDFLEEALYYYHLALELNERLTAKNSNQVVSSLSDIAEVYKTQGKYDLATDYFQRLYTTAINKNATDISVSQYLYKLGEICMHQKKNEDALNYFYDSLQILDQQTAPHNQQNVFVFTKMATIYKTQNKHFQAIEYLQRCISEYKVFSNDKEKLAKYYDEIAEIYCVLTDYEKAIKNNNLAEEILLVTSPDSLYLALIYCNLGNIYASQKEHDYSNAELYFLKALRIREKCCADTDVLYSVDVASVNCSLGNLMFMQNNTSRSVDYYREALFIYQQFYATNNKHPSIINTMYHLTEAYFQMNAYSTVLSHLETIIDLDENYKFAYYLQGKTYIKQDKFVNAQKAFEKAVSIDPSYADACIGILELKIKLAKVYDDAIFDALESDIEKTVNIKQSNYDELQTVKHSLLVNTNTFQYDRESNGLMLGVITDQQPPQPTYANVLMVASSIPNKQISAWQENLRRISSNTANNVAVYNATTALSAITLTAAEIEEFRNVQNNVTLTTGVNNKAAAHGIDSALLIQKVKISSNAKDELLRKEIQAKDATAKQQQPKQKCKVDSEDFQTQIDELKRQLYALNTRVSSIEERLSILDTKLYTLKHSMNIIYNTISTINNDITELTKDATTNETLLSDLRAKRDALKQREKDIKEFNKQPDLRDYYHSLLSEIEAIYIAAQALKSGHIDRTAEAQSTVSQVSSYISNLAALIPIVGQIAKTIIKTAGELYDVYGNALTGVELSRITELASTLEEYDQIALRIAVEMTIKNKDAIVELHGAKTNKDMKYYAGVFLKQGVSINTDNTFNVNANLNAKSGLAGLLEAFVANNDTHAKLLGRADGQKVICHLQQTAVAENYCYDDYMTQIEELSAKKNVFKTRHSLIAVDIVEQVSEKK